MRISRRIGAIILVIAYLLGVNPVYAQDSPRFEMSLQSGLPGRRVIIRQLDRCPESGVGTAQHVRYVFTDAAGTSTTPGPTTRTQSNGDWYGPLEFYVPARQISNLAPLTITPEAATGVGTLRVQCVVVDTGTLFKVTQEYAPQAFTVTGPTPRFSLSKPRVYPGESIEIAALQPCPLSNATVSGVISAQDYVPFSIKADPASGWWTLPVTIPEKVGFPGQPGHDIPPGKYRVWVDCSSGEDRQLYGSELLEIALPPVPYVAMGDSMSSGEGTFDYINTGNSCHRSKLAYPYFVAEKLQLGEPLHVACGGAVTDDFYVANPKNANEPAQLSHLTAETEVVTLTIGGNDTGFAYVLNKCVEGYRPVLPPLPVGWGCSDDKELAGYIDTRLDALKGKEKSSVSLGRQIHPLLEVYEKIHQAAPKAKIFVGGYPHLFGDNKEYFAQHKFAPSKRICVVSNIIYSIDYRDARWINKQADRLNELIQQQVDEARQRGVPITYVAPLFGGHHLCDKYETWINDVITGRDSALPESFHPMTIGHNFGYAIEFTAIIRRNFR